MEESVLTSFMRLKDRQGTMMESKNDMAPKRLSRDDHDACLAAAREALGPKAFDAMMRIAEEYGSGKRNMPKEGGEPK